MRLSEIEVDHEAIEGGTWRDAVGLPGVKLQVKGLGNMAYRRLQAALSAELAVAKRGAPIDPADEDALTAKLLHETILCGWQGFTEPGIAKAPVEGREPEPPQDREVPFTADLARQLLTEPRFRRFRDSVFATASILANETKAEREAAAKN